MEKGGEKVSGKKIRVAFVAGGLTAGGVESVIYNYVSHMEQENYEWFYISYDTPDSEVQEKFENLGFRVYSVTKKKENFFKSCKEVLHILKENKIDIVHSNMTLMCFVTNILGRMAGAKSYISHSHLAQYPTGIKKIVYFFFKCLSKWTATDYFACGHEAGTYLFGKKMMADGKVTILNNALDYERFCFQPEKREKIRKEYGLENRHVLGHIGRFTEQKNHEFLLKIFAAYSKRDPESRLVLLGNGPLMEKTEEDARKLGIYDKILFVGVTQAVDEWYMAMDVFVFPSLYEGLSVAALEAQISGLYIVSSDTVAGETALSEAMQFLSLNDTPEVWADKIQEVMGKRFSDNIQKRLRERNLDIFEEVTKLDLYYRNAVK